jgi:hypothetical protein
MSCEDSIRLIVARIMKEDAAGRRAPNPILVGELHRLVDERRREILLRRHRDCIAPLASEMERERS